MKHKHNGVLTVLIGFVILSACRQEPMDEMIDPCDANIIWTPVPPDTCFSLPINGLGYVNATMHWPVMANPHYCPFDAKKFVYLKGYNQGGDVYIYTLNLCTGDNALVLNDRTIYYPLWSDRDWILFNKGNVHLYKMKSNGDSLMLLNSLTSLKSYFWINDGLNIHARWENNSTEYGLIMNLQGEVLDTIPVIISRGDYRNHLLAVRGYVQNGNYIGIVNPDNWQFTPLVPYNGSNAPNSVNWLDDENIIWSNYDGIHTFNLITNQITTIKSTPCSNMRYASISAAKDGSGKILTTRVEYIYVKPDSLVHYQRISLLDTNTGQEWILGLD
ncbi:MAG: hypothetical protein HUU34_17170 [Saprospiraceae bacterium]|jgi:hypothetical protein|nr:hypothetical protein [Saprospiraceae bacterium]